MIKRWGYFIVAVIVLSACTPTVEVISSPVPISLPTFASTKYPSPTPTITSPLATRTPQPSATVTLAPSTTPAFDVASIATRTPSPNEKCPSQSNDIAAPNLSRNPENFSFSFGTFEQGALDFLNAGGNPSDLITSIRQQWKRREIYTRNEVIKDLTGDGVPEILIIPSEAYVFGCQNGEYQILLKHDNVSLGFNGIENQLVEIQDMNLDGVPEIVIANFGCGGGGAGQCLDAFIYEWDGLKFISLTPKWEGYDVGLSMIGGRLNDYLPEITIRDIDGNGTFELSLTGDIPSNWYEDYFSQSPWRDRSDIYSWNGHYFIFNKTEFSQPTYRYQAIQDGDIAMRYKEYDKALNFYQEAIFSDKLLGWSQAHKDRNIQLYNYTGDPNFRLTPTPSVPADDPLEYPNLAAYARYRIMLLHTLQGHMQEATVVYETLQEKSSDDKSGYEFAVIAQAFWNEYQSSQKVELACKKAISIAQEHSDVLRYLGSTYHGSQDMIYSSEDICPFK